MSQTKAKAPTASFLAWALSQLLLGLKFIRDCLFWGMLSSIIRREFSWKAWVFAASTMVFGTWGVAKVAFEGGPLGAGPDELTLWGGILLVAMIAGAWAAKLARSLALWECYLAVLVSAGLFTVELAVGWERFLGLQDTTLSHEFGLFGVMSQGALLLGSMWMTLVALATLGALVASVFGASFGYLVFSDDGKLDGHFDMEWMISRRHLAGRGGSFSVTAWVAIVGIALGVAALISVTSVMSGYQLDIQEKILSTNAHLVIQKYGIDFEEHEMVSTKVQDVEGVVAAAPFTFSEAMMSAGAEGIGVLVKGIDPARAAGVTSIEENLCVDVKSGVCIPDTSSGDESAATLRDWLGQSGGLPRAILGQHLFERIGKPIGSVVALTTPVGIAGAHGNAPKRIHVQITGVFRSGMYEFDSRLLYVALSTGQSLMGMGDAVSGVEIRVADPANVDTLSSQALATIGNYPYRTVDWRQLNSGIFTALKLQKIVMFLVLAFIVVVAAFNIASTLFMAVVERSHEIGVLKSMGVRDSSIMKIFVMEGWLVGGLGTLGGVLFGLAVCGVLARLDIGIAADVYMVEALQVRVDPLEVMMVMASAMVISHLATIFPALRAAGQQPVDAIRYD
ncbi:MAG: FtsX-like permease family protein [Myxococcota bacterium]|nr:FtsX-like permease family protein [Myxococcota bacterium]